MDESLEEPDYGLLYQRVLRMKVDELMQEPYDPPEDAEEDAF
jgi:hypothetical protein